MSKQTLDQQRAKHAFGVVRSVKADRNADRKQFKIQVKKLPARIVTSGLGQALAFLEAKAYAPELRAGLTNGSNNAVWSARLRWTIRRIDGFSSA